MKFLAFSQTKLGSSLSLPAHGGVGARATIKMIAPQKNRALPEKQKGKKEGGLGRNFCPFAIKNRAFPLFSD